MHQRIIHMHVNVSSKAYVYDDTIYNFCARARFAGCTYLRHIILALDIVYAGRTPAVKYFSFIPEVDITLVLHRVCLQGVGRVHMHSKDNTLVYQ
jgi:hypothetical protein